MRGPRDPRRFKRLRVSRRVDYSAQDAAAFGFTKDIGSDGLFLRTSHLLPEGADVQLGLALSNANEPVLLKGKVVRRSEGDPDSGLAIRFLPEAPEARAAVRDFVLGQLESKVLSRLEARPSSVEDLGKLADLRSEQGREDEALDLFRRAMELEPDTISLRGRFASLLAEQATRRSDVSLYEEALRVLEGTEGHDEDPAWLELTQQCRQALTSLRERRIEEEERLHAQIARARQDLQDSHTRLEQTSKELETSQRLTQEAQEELERARAKQRQDAKELARLKQRASDGRKALQRAREVLERQRHVVSNELDTERRALEAERVAVTQEKEVWREKIRNREEQLSQWKQQLAERTQLLRGEQDELQAARVELEKKIERHDIHVAQQGKRTPSAPVDHSVAEADEVALAARKEQLRARETELDDLAAALNTQHLELTAQHAAQGERDRAQAKQAEQLGGQARMLAEREHAARELEATLAGERRLLTDERRAALEIGRCLADSAKEAKASWTREIEQQRQLTAEIRRLHADLEASSNPRCAESLPDAALRQTIREAIANALEERSLLVSRAPLPDGSPEPRRRQPGWGRSLLKKALSLSIAHRVVAAVHQAKRPPMLYVAWGALATSLVAAALGVAVLTAGLLGEAHRTQVEPPERSSLVDAAMSAVPLELLKQESETIRADVVPGRSELSLQREQIVRAIAAHPKDALLSCLEATQRAEDQPLASEKLILNWEILSGGNVRAVHISAPASRRNTELESCLARAMGEWKFPAAKRRSLVRGFPLSALLEP